MDKPLLTTHEATIHLKKGEVFLCNVKTTQADVDAINALIHWLDGYSSGTGTGVPGHFELTCFFRSLRQNHNAKHGGAS